MLILGVDTELTDLDPAKAEIVELGLVLFDVSREMIIACYSQVFYTEGWSEEAAACHGIPREVSLASPQLSDVLDPWKTIRADQIQFIVAHNARCDHPMVTRSWPSFLSKPWLCTNEDLPHLDKLSRANCTRLAHLCLDYGIPMSGAWHRALADAEGCARIAAKHNLQLAYERKMAPKFRLVAHGDFIPNIKEKLQEAPSVAGTNRRYSWDGETKTWAKDGLFKEDIKADAEYIKQVTGGRWSFDVVRLDPKPY